MSCISEFQCLIIILSTCIDIVSAGSLALPRQPRYERRMVRANSFVALPYEQRAWWQTLLYRVAQKKMERDTYHNMWMQ